MINEGEYNLSIGLFISRHLGSQLVTSTQKAITIVFLCYLFCYDYDAKPCGAYIFVGKRGIMRRKLQKKARLKKQGPIWIY